MLYDNSLNDINLISTECSFWTWCPHEIITHAETLGGRTYNDEKDDVPPYLAVAQNSTRKDIFPLVQDRNRMSYFEKFVNMPPTNEEFLAYADNYGPLVFENDAIIPCNPQKVFFTQSLRFWRRMHYLIKLSFDLALMIDKKNVVDLFKLFDTQQSDYVSFKHGQDSLPYGEYALYNQILGLPHLKLEVVRIEPNGDEYFKLSGEIALPSKEVLKKLGVANNCVDLTTYATLLLFHLLGSHMRDYPVFASPTISKGIIADNFHPSSLLGLLWYTVYQIAIGEKKYKRCKICNGWMDATKHAGLVRHDRCARKVQDNRTALRDGINRLLVKGLSTDEVIERLACTKEDYIEAIKPRKKGRKPK